MQVFNLQSVITMKQIFSLFIFTCCIGCVDVLAQDVITYTYDASGNNTSRFQKAQSFLKSSLTDSSDGVSYSNAKDFDVILSTSENSIKIYPNPNNGQFQIEMNGFDDVLTKGMITIFSVKGQVVLKSSSLQEINSFNISNQPNGTYILQINIDGKTFTHKVIISK